LPERTSADGIPRGASKEDTAAFKILIEENTNRILGAHIVGPSASFINLFALVISLELPSDKLRHLVPTYPSQAANLEYMLG
jgi:glutathione reductase (NADPH)